MDFYPRPPRGGRQDEFEKLEKAREISIHALREEGDKTSSKSLKKLEKFLSTPSARRATSDAQPTGIEYVISIHALREEGDRGRKG